MSYKKIDFSKPLYVETSRRGEQVIEGVKVQGLLSGRNSSYVNITYNNPVGRDERIPLSPSQARCLGELLINYANQEEFGRFKPEALEFEIPEEKGPDPDRPSAEHQWFVDWKGVNVRFSKHGLTLNQSSRDYLRPNAVDVVHLSPTQLESFIRQGVKHSPTFRRLLNKALEEVV